MKTVKSSNIAAYEYDEKTHTLTIQFKSGDIYRFERVPPDISRGLDSALSVGQHFHKNIKGRFKFTKIGGVKK